MALPRGLAAFNRRVTNHVTGPFAGRLPGFGVVVHRGRRSGREYRSPVNAFVTTGGYVLALTYGTESDWVKNVMAAGNCDLVNRGRTVHLTAPEIVHDETRRYVPGPVRPLLRALGVADFMRLTRAPS
ncbi:MAG TPA: nitroreductase family deazaflavin-dependent oxidoreductase [Acidimicrobiales bacterium]|nr:nitroreductase family deazaflavin-dependent oxidoreductase [Acidimicrobiales bacterium]